MSKYNDFEDFMHAVIDCADYKSKSRYGKSIYEAYGVTEKVLAITLTIIDSGWGKFLAVATLLALGPFAFGAAFLAFIGNPIGITLGLVLAAYGGVKVIKYLYDNRKLPLAIKNTGESYKSSFENRKGNIPEIDQLIHEASEYLINDARS